MRTLLAAALTTTSLLALGACAPLTDASDLTADQIALICDGSTRGRVVATGLQTGDVRQDYQCRSRNPGGIFDRADRNVDGDDGARSRATDRAMRGGR
jgi:hypothetical protein